MSHHPPIPVANESLSGLASADAVSLVSPDRVVKEPTGDAGQTGIAQEIQDQNIEPNQTPLEQAESKPEDSSSFVADSLALGITVMLAMTVLQRGLGFFRGLWFCRQLDDAVVGQWSMAYDFITMITPVLLLGLPGSLPRYVEHYRMRGQLKPFSKHLFNATMVIAITAFAGILLAPDWFGWLVFLEPQNQQLVYSVAVAMMTIVGFNHIYQMVSSLRQVRVASIMQFVQSVVFTFAAIGWLSMGGGLVGIIYCYVAATIAGVVPGFWSLQKGWRGLEVDNTPFDAPKMWKRLIPYAAAIWAMNLLTNTFTLSDRYMILHLMPGGEEATQGAVGQYHSARIIPMLLVSLATMIGGVLMPYLTADWEAGRRELVCEKIKRLLFAMSVIFTAGAAIAIFCSPWFFGTLLENRYTAGMSLMPMAFVFSIWMSLGFLGQDYLWVAERGKWVAVALAIGFTINILLNFALLPIWGLWGAVIATLISNGVVLLGVLFAMWRWGYQLDRSTWVGVVLPSSLLIHPSIALVGVLAACVTNGQTRQWCGEALAITRQKWLKR